VSAPSSLGGGCPCTGVATARARRLALTGDELAVLRARAGNVTLPPAFVPTLRAGGPDPEAALEQAAAALTGRGVLVGDGEARGSIQESVAASLRVVGRPDVLVTTRGRLRGVQVVAAHALAGTLGTGLVRAGDQIVELSLFDPVTLAGELARVVPPTAAGVAGRAAVTVGLHEITAALAEVGPAGGAAVAGLGGAIDGTLQVVIAGRPVADLDLVTVGAVVWLCGPDGWVGLRPVAAPSGRRRVTLEPVEPDHLGSWVAPMVAGVLA
jgi:hypothetical protein